MFQTSKGFTALCVAAMSAMYLGCGSDGEDGKDGQNGLNGLNGKDGVSAIVTTTGEPAGSNCKNGGTKIEIGKDADGDGVLIESEISSTQYVCNGEAGAPGNPGQPGTPGASSTIATTTLAAGQEGCQNGGVKIEVTTGDTSNASVVCNGEAGAPGAAGTSASVATATEPAGANCQNGGVKIEITNGTSKDTKYVCNGADGASGTGNAISTATEAAGANCQNGGIKVGVTVGESTQYTYVCNGADGAPGAAGTSSTMVTTNLSAGDANCANGGVKIEVTTGSDKETSYVCNGANGTGTPGANGHSSLLNMTDYTGDQCASGAGIKLESGLDANDNGVLDAGEVSDTKYVCNGSDVPVTTGCIGKAEDYCLNKAVEEDTLLGMCDTTTGDCVECLADADCGEKATCESNVCVSKCGNGRIDDINEACDPTVDPSLWNIAIRSCDDVTGPGSTGTVTCNDTCTNVITDSCEAPDACAGVASDAACVDGADNGPVSCADFFEDDTVANTNVVCKAHDTCPDVMVLDNDATEDACILPTPPINWCNNQGFAEGIEMNAVELKEGGSTMASIYARISTQDVDKVSVAAFCGASGSDVSTWTSYQMTKLTTAGLNTTYYRAFSLSDMAGGAYKCTVGVKGVDSDDWFYCGHTGVRNDNDNDNGSAPPVQNLAEDQMITLTVTKSVVSYDETWGDLENNDKLETGSYESADIDDFIWSYKAKTYAGTGSNYAYERGILLANDNTNFIESPVTSVGTLSIEYGKGSSNSAARCIKAIIDGVTYYSGPYTPTSDAKGTVWNVGTINKKNVTIRIQHDNSKEGCGTAQLEVGPIHWTSY